MATAVLLKLAPRLLAASWEGSHRKTSIGKGREGGKKGERTEEGRSKLQQTTSSLWEGTRPSSALGRNFERMEGRNMEVPAPGTWSWVMPTAQLALPGFLLFGREVPTPILCICPPKPCV